jgi:hypothetical protein
MYQSKFNGTLGIDNVVFETVRLELEAIRDENPTRLEILRRLAGVKFIPTFSTSITVQRRTP